MCEHTYVRTCMKNILPDLPKLLLGRSPPSSSTAPLHTHITISLRFLKKGFLASLAFIQYSGIFDRSNKVAYFVNRCPAAEIGKYNFFYFYRI